MQSLLEKIVFKIYIQDVLDTINRMLRINTNHRIVFAFLDEIFASSENYDEVLKLASQHFESKSSEFCQICFRLLEQILTEQLVDIPNLSIANLKYNDIQLIIRLSDSLGRFDLGYLFRVQF